VIPFNLHNLRKLDQKMVEFVRLEQNLTDDWIMYDWEILESDSIKVTLFNKHFPYEDFERVSVIITNVDEFINNVL
jgi:hypothetical protein